jgi:hypothetical protein
MTIRSCDLMQNDWEKFKAEDQSRVKNRKMTVELKSRR